VISGHEPHVELAGMSIYVEIPIPTPMDALWAHTQMPAQHVRWDQRDPATFEAEEIRRFNSGDRES